jgi:cobalt-zinc-cadmium resistance protein CzcA
MIRRLVDFALNNRFLVLAAALLLFVWGAISFHQLPVEAYPDVADNYVEIVTQWPGISAEQMEQQVTIPLEIVMNGMPHVTHLRSFSLFGLSDIKLIFDDDEENFRDRERALERLTQVTLPPGVTPQMQTDWSPAGQIYFFTLHSTNPAYDVMELKSIEDWVVEKNFKSVPNIVDVASFGGPTREYQVRVDPEKLISYGLSIGQVEQQLTNNNANGGGSFVEAGLQQINIQEVGLVRNVQDIANTVIMAKNGTPLRVKDIAVVSQGPKIRLGQFAVVVVIAAVSQVALGYGTVLYRTKWKVGSFEEAVALACRVRLRPVLMTSLATLIGLLPLALKLGTGGEAYAPLAQAIIGGLAVSVVLTVFIVPAAYLIIYGKLDAANSTGPKEDTIL